jgi:squalene-hopene/tetraprenyl-beta-curcumene cyclase
VTTTQADSAGLRAAATAALGRAAGRLVELQDPEGWWQGGGSASVAWHAAEVLARHVLGMRAAGLTSDAALCVAASQLADGSWPGQAGGPGDLSTSVLAYCALRLAGDPADAYHMALAASWIRDAGGITAASAPATTWLAMVGQADWDAVRVPSPEVVYLPAPVAVRAGDEAGLDRSAVVPLAVIGALRPVRELPFGLAELRVPDAPARGSRETARPALRVPAVPAVRAAALRRCGEWIVARLQRAEDEQAAADGWPYSLIALRLLGYPADHQVLAPRNPAACSPARVAGTAVAVCALADAGLPADHPALMAAGHWLLGELTSPGARATAHALLALRRVALPAEAGVRLATVRAIRWLASAQRADGGWDERAGRAGGALGGRLPVLPGGSPAELTGHVLRALGTVGQPGSRAIRRGVVHLLGAQQLDGCWPGSVGTSELRATCVVLPALIAAGVLPGKPVITRAVGWLAARQHQDGGWADPVSTGTGLTALLAAGGARTLPAARHAVDWLVQAQLPDGGWGYPERAGSSADGGFDQIVTPLTALGRYLGASRG